MVPSPLTLPQCIHYGCTLCTLCQVRPGGRDTWPGDMAVEILGSLWLDPPVERELITQTCCCLLRCCLIVYIKMKGAARVNDKQIA